MPYHDKIVWKQPVSENVVEHHDGVLSMLATWDGLRTDLLSPHEHEAQWSKFKDILHILSDKYSDILIEQHLFRERDSEMVDAYLSNHKKNMVRAKDMAEPIVNDLANLYSQYARTNTLALVIVYKPKTGLIKKKAGTRSQKKAIEYMMGFAQQFKNEFPELLIRNLDYYSSVVRQCAQRRRYNSKDSKIQTDYRFPLNEQWIEDKPNLTSDGFIEVEGVLTKIGLLYMQPDATLAEFRRFASVSNDLHFVQIISPINTEKRLEKIDHNNDITAAAASKGRGRRKATSYITSADAFASYVSNNNERIYNNCWLVHIHGNPDHDLNQQKESINNVMTALNGLLRNGRQSVGEFRYQKNFQMFFWRVGLIGHGYCSNYFREDHTTQVINLSPVITFDKGIVGGPSLRMADNGQLVGFDRFKSSVAHSFTVAMTRAGKGTEKCMEIIETFSNGVSWFGIEYGGTYEFLVHGLGGNYIRADIETSINPFPSKSQYLSCDDKTKKELRLITLEGLAFILVGRLALSDSQEVVAGLAYDSIYNSELSNDEPVTSDFLNGLKAIEGGLQTDSQKKSCVEMIGSLSDFLATSAGEALNKPTNVDFNNGIVIVDFKRVALSSKKQAIYLLNYTTMKFMQESAMRKGHVVVMFDEVHKFSDMGPEATDNALNVVCRTGGKDMSWADIITQGLSEIQNMNSEILGSIPNQNLLYRQDQFDEIGHRLNMPDHVIEYWANLENPLDKKYRPHVKKVGDSWYGLHNFFPKDLLDIASTTGEELEIKPQIADEYKDSGIWVMLEEFRKKMELVRL